jgi:tetratricopeptide (TPR) repeat protein
MSKKSKAPGDSFETVENALTRSEQYIEENRKSLTIIIVAILAVVGLFIGYKNFYLEPKETEAQSQMFMAEKYFEIDSFLYALEGDDQYPGFLEIIDDYAATKSANLAKGYAGICYLRLGEYEDAIEYLEDFDANDMMISIVAVGATGDAYVELEELEKGASYYEKAANLNENGILTPIYLFKAGLVEEELGNYKKAIGFYKKIKEKYPQSDEAKTIDKYIMSAELKM